MWQNLTAILRDNLHGVKRDLAKQIFMSVCFPHSHIYKGMAKWGCKLGDRVPTLSDLQGNLCEKLDDGFASVMRSRHLISSTKWAKKK